MVAGLSLPTVRPVWWFAAAVLCVCALVGFRAAVGGQSGHSGPAPTPTVDIGHARAVYQSGGELTSDEVVALRLALVGNPADISPLKITDAVKYTAAQEAFHAKEGEFAKQLEQCKLKESVGWAIGWGPLPPSSVNPVPGVVRLNIIMHDPSTDDVQRGYFDGFITDLSDKELAGMKFGQRIRFSGDLGLVNGRTSLRNAKITPLVDDPSAPTPTANELRDLNITLGRSCFGSCPDYIVTVTADGQVTFDGEGYTRVRGTVTTTISIDKVVELAQEIKRADFFSLSDSYQADLPDLPAYRISVQTGGQSKKVWATGGSPARLSLLADRVDQIVNTDQWIK